MDDEPFREDFRGTARGRLDPVKGAIVIVQGGAISTFFVPADGYTYFRAQCSRWSGLSCCKRGIGHAMPHEAPARSTAMAASRLLIAASLGQTLDELVRDVSNDPAASRGLGGSGVRAVLTEAARFASARPLAPPARAAFLQRHPEAVEQLDMLAKTVGATLDEYLRAPEARPVGSARLAFEYAAVALRAQAVVQTMEEALVGGAPLQASLSRDDRGRIEDYFVYRGVLGGPVLTLDALVRTWERLVVKMEGNDPLWLHEEHTNWLDARDHLDEAMSLLAPPGLERVEQQTRILDRRFVDATRTTTRPIRHLDPWQPQAWWWFRLPLRMGPSFTARVRRLTPELLDEPQRPV